MSGSATVIPRVRAALRGLGTRGRHSSVAAITTPLGQPVRSGPRIIELAAQGLSNREAASELPPSLSWPRHNQHYQHSSRHAIVKRPPGQKRVNGGLRLW